MHPPEPRETHVLTMSRIQKKKGDILKKGPRVSPDCPKRKP